MDGRTRLDQGAVQKDKARIDVHKRSSSSGYGEMSLKFAQVEQVNQKEGYLKLRILTGEDDIYAPTPIPLTYPSAGRRRILGSMPERGDYCIVGWMLQDSSGQASSRAPVVVAWSASPPWMGHDWVPSQEYEPGEGQDIPSDRVELEGAAERTRYKLRHFDPGSVFASSSQGSDLVLDEDVLISNRRGNEIVLRDSDQSLVTRSISGHNVTGGTRVYSGPVQRDARLLPTQMFSDGLYWDTPMLVDPDTGEPITQSDLRDTSGLPGSSNAENQYRWPSRFLTPGLPFQRDPGDTLSDFESEEGNRRFQDSLDPFSFLRWGLLVTPTGFQNTDTPDAVYGGKAIYRVGLNRDDDVIDQTFNAVIDDEFPDSLVEYRVEVTHTHDGTLPVTEQTDGFDADRLPSRSGLDRNPNSVSDRSPFIEFVLGSVVGNDPYSEGGVATYGVPLAPQVFSGEDANPGMVSGFGLPLGDHAASLFRVTPPIGDLTAPSTFFSVTKDGRLKAAVRGPESEPYAAEAYFNSGLRLQVDGDLNIGASRLAFNLSGSEGFSFRSETGPVTIYGGGRDQSGGVAARALGQENLLPNVLIEGKRVVKIQAGKLVGISASDIEIDNASSVNVEALQLISLQAGDRLQSSTKDRQETTSGKSTQIFSGPRNGLPTAGSVRKIDIIANPATGFVGGTNDEYFNLYGDRQETFAFGDHTTTCLVGNLTYETNVGEWKCRAGANQITVGIASGTNVSTTIGNTSLNTVAGAFTSQSSVSATVKTLGPAVLSGAASVYLGGPGKIGPIVSGADLDPLTGLPLISLGMGSPGHLIGTPI